MIMENSVSSFLNSRSMTKIDTFKLEFYCRHVAIQPHRSQVYKTRVLKPKPSLTNSIFVGLEEKQNLKNATLKKMIWLEKKEEKQSDLGGRSGAGGRSDLRQLVFFFFSSSLCFLLLFFPFLRESVRLHVGVPTGTGVSKTRVPRGIFVHITKSEVWNSSF